MSSNCLIPTETCSIAAYAKALVVCVGNSLRGDDGFGEALFNKLSRLAKIDFDILVRHQLLPELAETLMWYDIVIFVDAQEGQPRGEIQAGKVRPSPAIHTSFFHRFEPSSLLFMCETLYGHAPEAFVVALLSDDFPLRESLSVDAQFSLEIAHLEIKNILTHCMMRQFSTLQVDDDYNSLTPYSKKFEDKNVDRTQIYEFVSKTRDKVLQKLEETKTPAYPRYYEKAFKETVIGIENEEFLKLYKRYSETANKSNPDEEMDKYIRLAKESVDNFSDSNRTITKVARAQNDYLESVRLEDLGENRINYEKITSSLLVFQNQLLEELKKSDDKIRKLESELQSALNESKIDPLTKTLNKRAFVSDMNAILEAGSNKELSMAIVRIVPDGFHRINELYGHMAGDKILIFLANTFRNSLRDGDKIYRYEDDEFIIFLNRLSGEKAVEIAGRIKSKVEASKLIYSEEVIRVTISVGLTSHEVSDSLDDMMRRASKALSEARERQNCVVENI